MSISKPKSSRKSFKENQRQIAAAIAFYAAGRIEPGRLQVKPRQRTKRGKK